ncbi:hypothetical protein [uncultured Mediterranean phage uvMED]|nr:hypothetical protein [uncultured Mediterranean phage uvMED]
MPRHHNINGVQVPFTAEEEAQRDAEEQAWNDGSFDRAMVDLRQRRNTLLSASDWTQLPDTTLTTAEKTAWMNYRTELRNITNGLTTVEDVNGISFPVKPN